MSWKRSWMFPGAFLCLISNIRLAKFCSEKTCSVINIIFSSVLQSYFLFIKKKAFIFVYLKISNHISNIKEVYEEQGGGMKIMLVLVINFLWMLFCFIYCSNKSGSSPNGSPDNTSLAPSKKTYFNFILCPTNSASVLLVSFCSPWEAHHHKWSHRRVYLILNSHCEIVSWLFRWRYWRLHQRLWGKIL